MAPGKRYTYWTGRRRPSLPSTIGDPSEGADQQGYPTSQFGDTIPVAWGKCRLPASYIWSTGVITRIIKVMFLPDIIQLLLTARLRFASPLEVDSRWQVRRMWADGKLIFDATTGLKRVNFAVYDGHSSQGRDSAQEAALGTANTSAHRGYMDIVIYSYDIGFLADNPPLFEAEWIQESLNTTDVDTFDTLISGVPTLAAARDFDEHEFYSFSPSNGYIRRFSIGRLREIYAARLLMLARTYVFYDESSLRYVPQTGKLLMLAAETGGWPYYLIEADPLTGQITAEAAQGSGWPSGSDPVVTTCHVYISGVSIYLRTGLLENLTIYRVKQTGLPAERITRTYQSGTSWEGYTVIRCMTVGEVRTDEADIWICADDDLVKLVVNINGAIVGRSVFKTFADGPVYAVYYDSDVIVWTDNAQVIRVDGSTATTLWTETVPYQLNADPTLRGMGDPDKNRFDGVLLAIENTTYNFTSLKTGLTVEVARSAGLAFHHIYDSITKTLITTDNAGAPTRTIFDFVGDGTQRNLSDFLVALMVRGGIEAEHVICENIDDVIDGAVVDITTGVRDIAMSICEPYGIAMFER